MHKPSSPRPAAALDSRQLDLPLFEEPAGGAPAAPPSPSSVAPRAPDGSRLRSLTLSGRTLAYSLKRSSRRTIGFSIDGNGLAITAPRWVTLADIEAAIADKERWIFAKLAEWQTRVEQRALPRIDWKEGAQFPYLGKPVSVTLSSPHGALAFDAERASLALALPAHAQEQQIKDRVQGWLQGEAKRLFGERLAIYADKLGVGFSGYALSSAATRWGSCSSDGKIRLNWRLIHFPLSIIDYVVAHELAHLREMNHSPRFWQTVESIFPEFREARHTLKHHPPELLPAL
jgi:predicted metal-dependent hydrolase